MKKLRTDIATAKEGSVTVEFVLILPFLIMLLAGMLQLCLFYLANAGLEQAVEAGARYATIYPRPSDAQITALIHEAAYGMDPAGIRGPTLTHGKFDGADYVDISMRYSMPMNFIFFEASPIELQYARRAYQI